MTESLSKEFQSLVISKFKTASAFGLAIHWVPSKVSRLFNGRYIPKLTEAALMCQVLGLTLDELAYFFA